MLRDTVAAMTAALKMPVCRDETSGTRGREMVAELAPALESASIVPTELLCPHCGQLISSNELCSPPLEDVRADRQVIEESAERAAD